MSLISLEENTHMKLALFLIIENRLIFLHHDKEKTCNDRSLVSQFPAQADSGFTVGLRSADVYRQKGCPEREQTEN